MSYSINNALEKLRRHPHVTSVLSVSDNSSLVVLRGYNPNLEIYVALTEDYTFTEEGFFTLHRLIFTYLQSRSGTSETPVTSHQETFDSRSMPSSDQLIHAFVLLTDEDGDATSTAITYAEAEGIEIVKYPELYNLIRTLLR